MNTVDTGSLVEKEKLPVSTECKLWHKEDSDEGDGRT